MASVFLSYSRQDVGRVSAIAVALEREGHSVWWDQHISGGEEFADAIEQALVSADAVIVCWSATSVHSAWVRDEAASGRDRGCLVPLTLDGTQPPLGFRQYQTVDLSRWNRRAQSRALDPRRAAIAEKAGGESRPTSKVASARRRFEPGRRIAAAAVLILAAGGAFLYARMSGQPDTVEPKVAVGQFGLVSAGLPRALPNMVGQEIVAAFGAENAVAVVSPGDPLAECRPVRTAI